MGLDWRSRDRRRENRSRRWESNCRSRRCRKKNRSRSKNTSRLNSRRMRKKRKNLTNVCRKGEIVDVIMIYEREFKLLKL